MKKYFLVARNRKTNEFDIIELKETWYLGRQSGREGVFSRENSLEAIDLVTTRFTSEQEMAKRMSERGYIADEDVDIFIAAKSNDEGKINIDFEEPIYNMGNEKRTGALRKLARDSISSKNPFYGESLELGIIYDELIDTAFFVDDFYSAILSGETSIPTSFVEKLRRIYECTDVPYQLKDSFETDNYETVRSIVDTISRFKMFRRSSREDATVLFENEKSKDRMRIMPELALQLDDNYIEGQLSLESYLQEETTSTSEDLRVKKEPTIEKIHIPRSGVTDDEKRKKIFKILKTCKPNTFYLNRKDDKFYLNYSLFKCQPLESEKKKLDTYLTGNLPWYITDYIIYSSRLQSAIDNDTITLYDQIQLEASIKTHKEKINKRLKNPKCLNMVYEWCVLYDGCRKREASYDDSSSLGDGKGKPYVKK